MTPKEIERSMEKSSRLLERDFLDTKGYPTLKEMIEYVDNDKAVFTSKPDEKLINIHRVCTKGAVIIRAFADPEMRKMFSMNPFFSLPSELTLPDATAEDRIAYYITCAYVKPETEEILDAIIKCIKERLEERS